MNTIFQLRKQLLTLCSLSLLVLTASAGDTPAQLGAYLEKDKLANKKTIPVWLGFAKSRIYHICLAGIGSILMLNLLVQYNTPMLGIALFALLIVLHQFLNLEQKQYEEYNTQLKFTSLTILLISVTFFGHALLYYFTK